MTFRLRELDSLHDSRQDHGANRTGDDGAECLRDVLGQTEDLIHALEDPEFGFARLLAGRSNDVIAELGDLASLVAGGSVGLGDGIAVHRDEVDLSRVGEGKVEGGDVVLHGVTVAAKNRGGVGVAAIDVRRDGAEIGSP